jgi:hypothetical protein
MMARQARDTSMITDRRQAHDHQVPCLFLVTTRPSAPEHLNCRALLDTTPLPVKVRDGVFGDPVSAHLTLALDMFTHSAVAFRLTLVSDCPVTDISARSAPSDLHGPFLLSKMQVRL